MDFQRLHRLHAAKAFFVIRSKCNLRFYVVESRKVDKTTGVRCDQTIRLNFRKSVRGHLNSSHDGSGS